MTSGCGNVPPGDAARRLLLLGHLPGHMLSVAKTDGQVVYVTPSVQDTLGYTPEEFATRLPSPIHDDDLEQSSRVWRDVTKNPGREASLQCRVRHADGRWRWLECIGINASGDAAINGVLWSYRDVTERFAAEAELVASEERLRSMLEQTYDIFLVVDRDLNVTWANPQLTRTLGYEINEILGRSILENVHADDVDIAAENLLRALDGEVPDDPTVLRSLTKSGEWLWFDVVGADLLANPLVDGYVLCLREITHRHEVELDRRATEASACRCSWPWTTSVPGTRRSATCGASPSTS